MDDFKSKLQDTIIILASNVDDTSMVATVPKSLTTNNVKAGDLIKQMAPIVGVRMAVQIWLKVAVHKFGKYLKIIKLY